MDLQRTVRRQVACAGIGLHSGKKVTLTLKPAAADTGIWFKRTDIGGPEIPASLLNVSATNHATGLTRDGASVDTVEHLLAALVSLGIDNVLVELDHPEVPIMDGSAAPFVFLIQEAGIRSLGVPRRYLKVTRPVTVSKGDKLMSLYPADHFKITYSISFDHPLLRHQSHTLQVTEESFIDQIAPARTFGFLHEVELMRQHGLALGGSLENAIVLSETGVLNHQLRFEDEFVRHKMLDAIGDLALLGYPIIGHVVAHRAGHALHSALGRRLLDEPDAWTIVESATAAARSDVPVAVPIKA